jgi:DNA-binding transcriptional regulator YbjK
MNESDPLLQKADALMQRHRSIAANTAATSAADDVPVLTEIVTAERRSVDRGTSPDSAPKLDEAAVEALVRERLDKVLPNLRRQVAHELDAWFDEQLPKIVMSLLDGFTDRLVGQISAQARGDLMTWLQTAGEDIEPKPPQR